MKIGRATSAMQMNEHMMDVRIISSPHATDTGFGSSPWKSTLIIPDTTNTPNVT
jgi:hypothetical protein